MSAPSLPRVQGGTFAKDEASPGDDAVCHRRRTVLGAAAALALPHMGRAAADTPASPARVFEPTGATVAAELQFPEGPVAMADGSLLVVEIGASRLSRIEPGGKVQVVAQTGGGPNGAAMGPDGACYVANNGGYAWRTDSMGQRVPAGRAADYAGGRIDRVELQTGRVEPVCMRSTNGPLSAPNDLVFDRTGGCWFTDHGHSNERSVDRGTICYLPAGASVARVGVRGMLTPNGIRLSPDEKSLYVSETVTGRVWSFDVESPGTLKLSATPPSLSSGRLVYATPWYCLLDSMAIEAGGNLCIAVIGIGGQAAPGGAGILVVSPDGGLVEHRYLQDRATTNLCFGGSDLKTAYITQSRAGKIVALGWERPGLPLNFRC